MRSNADDSKPNAAEQRAGFDPDSTQKFQARMPSAPAWFSSMAAGNSREKARLRAELGQIRGGISLLMKQRNGGKWTSDDKRELKAVLQRVSALSPYLLVWVLPGSVLILPFLAWHLDTRRKRRDASVST